MARLGHVGGQGLIGAGLVLLAVQHVVLLHDLVVESVHLPQLVHLLELAVQNVPAGNKLGTSNLRRKKKKKEKKKRAISEMPMALEETTSVIKPEAYGGPTCLGSKWLLG